MGGSHRFHPLILIGFVLLFPLGSLSFAQTVTVPDVRGNLFNVADTTLKGAGLHAEVEGYAPTNSRESQGKVFAQTPPPNTQVARDSKVQLRIFFLSGSQVAVPSVTQRPLATAYEFLDHAGLQRRIVGFTETRNPAQVNTVAGQNPPAASLIERGKVVDLTLFRAPIPPSVQIPSVEGQSVEEARRILAQARLNARVVGSRETRDPAQHAHVATQVPRPGIQASVGSEISLTLYAVPLVSISLVYRGMDADLVGPGRQPTPDGRMDGHLTLTFDTGVVRRVLTVIRLQRADARGVIIPGEEGWSTLLAIPRILGVYRDNRRLNPTGQNISDPIQGRVTYELYAYDPVLFSSPTNFLLTVVFADGGKAVAPVRVGPR